jgi:signal transduction histidine kinase
VTLRARLVVAAAYLLTAVVLALEIPLALSVERRATSEFRSAVFGRAAILAARVSDLVPTAGAAAGADVQQRLQRIVAEAARGNDERILVTDADGRVLVDSTGEARAGAVYATAARPEFQQALTGTVDFRRRYSETLGEELLLVTTPVVDSDRVVGSVRVSASTAAVSASVRQRWLSLALIGLAVIIAGLALAGVLATSLARPVGALAGAADRLARGDLAARAPVAGPKEVASVATSFNRMAAALSATLASQRDFVANASHQLRTPLTGLKLRLEALRGEGGAVADQVAKAEAELDRLSKLVDDLLELARASATEATGKPVDLAAAAREAVERWRRPVEHAGKHLRLGADEAALVWASETDVAHVLDNLIENALRYCPPGASISVETRNGAAEGVLAVADDGPGIASADRERVFERFYRGAVGKQAGPGTGLGLAIVAELVRRWGGDVRLLDGPGTRIEGAFPSVPSDSLPSATNS